MQNNPMLIIIRGPAGAGKTTIASALRDELGKAVFFDIDYYCLASGGHPKNKLQRFVAHEMVSLLSKRFFKDYDIILERMFSDQEDIDHIRELFSWRSNDFHIFTLKSSINSLIKNDSRRRGSTHLGPRVIRLLSERFNNSGAESGIIISVDRKSVKKIVSEIMNHLSS